MDRLGETSSPLPQLPVTQFAKGLNWGPAHLGSIPRSTSKSLFDPGSSIL